MSVTSQPSCSSRIALSRGKDALRMLRCIPCPKDIMRKYLIFFIFFCGNAI